LDKSEAREFSSRKQEKSEPYSTLILQFRDMRPFCVPLIVRIGNVSFLSKMDGFGRALHALTAWDR
jgi:hypothetical protein